MPPACGAMLFEPPLASAAADLGGVPGAFCLFCGGSLRLAFCSLGGCFLVAYAATAVILAIHPEGAASGCGLVVGAEVLEDALDSLSLGRPAHFFLDDLGVLVGAYGKRGADAVEALLGSHPRRLFESQPVARAAACLSARGVDGEDVGAEGRVLACGRLRFPACCLHVGERCISDAPRSLFPGDRVVRALDDGNALAFRPILERGEAVCVLFARCDVRVRVVNGDIVPRRLRRRTGSSEHTRSMRAKAISSAALSPSWIQPVDTSTGSNSACAAAGETAKPRCLQRRGVHAFTPSFPHFACLASRSAAEAFHLYTVVRIECVSARWGGLFWEGSLHGEHVISRYCSTSTARCARWSSMNSWTGTSRTSPVLRLSRGLTAKSSRVRSVQALPPWPSANLAGRRTTMCSGTRSSPCSIATLPIGTRCSRATTRRGSALSVQMFSRTRQRTVPSSCSLRRGIRSCGRPSRCLPSRGRVAPCGGRRRRRRAVSLHFHVREPSTVKPQVEYYAEVLANCGLSADEVLMVGNNTLDDLVSADLGCDVYLVTDHLIISPWARRREALNDGRVCGVGGRPSDLR